MRLLSLKVSVYTQETTFKITRNWCGCPRAQLIRTECLWALDGEHFDLGEPTALDLKAGLASLVIPVWVGVCPPHRVPFREGQLPPGSWGPGTPCDVPLSCLPHENLPSDSYLCKPVRTCSCYILMRNDTVVSQSFPPISVFLSFNRLTGLLQSLIY